MTDVTVSGPFIEPATYRCAATWLVVLKCGDRVDVHRFPTREDADAFIAEVGKS
jgi:hypothetical protein